MAKTDLQAEWENRIAAFRASGQTQSNWCRANDLSLHKLRYWLKKLENRNSEHSPTHATKWIPIAFEESLQDLNESLQIKVGQVSIEVKPGFNPSLLAEVIRTIKLIC